MYYFLISLINSPLEPLTYKSLTPIPIGTKVTVGLKMRTNDGVIVATCEEPSFRCLEILEISDFYYSSLQIQNAGFISYYYMCSLGEALGLALPFSQQEQKQKSEDMESSLTLSQKQNSALEFLKQHKVAILFGDTGSGKTEIYMRYFEEMILQSKRAIFLMPEISLTPQMSKRLKAHFGEKVAMWHSKLTPLQKKNTLASIHDGTAYIVAGPRSALFLPIKELGLIVVDEEHDDSYKSSKRPRYNARDMAIYMGKLYGVNVVLGSATPSLTSYEKFPHFRLRGGYFESKREFIYEKGVENISFSILKNIEEKLQKKEQTILFLPTRANFKYLICKDCGYGYKCVFCDVSLSLHHMSNTLKCHYCNFAQAIPKSCTQCKGSTLVSSRMGTAEVVKTLKERFEDAVIEQFDRDAITTSKKLESTLKRFNKKEIDILVGTQMISKGHDYHGVSLAVVLGLDNMLNMSDHRAREKALSALIQVAGRSGRKDNAKVLVQTFNEEFFRGYLDDYEHFLQEEREYKKGLYPPYKRLSRILFSHKNGTKAKDEMLDMVQKLKENQNIEVVGFGKCGIEKVADKYRFEILIRADKSTQIINALRTCRSSLAQIDMDPIDFS